MCAQRTAHSAQRTAHTRSSTWVPGRSKSLEPLIISPAQLSGQLLRSLEAPRGLSAGTYVARSGIFRRIRVYVFRRRYVTMFPRTLNFCYLIAVRRSPFVLKQFVGRDTSTGTEKRSRLYGQTMYYCSQSKLDTYTGITKITFETGRFYDYPEKRIPPTS